MHPDHVGISLMVYVLLSSSNAQTHRMSITTYETNRYMCCYQVVMHRHTGCLLQHTKQTGICAVIK